MKRFISLAVVVGVLILGACMLRAQTPVDTEVKNFAAPVYCWSTLNVVSNGLYVGGVLTVPSNTLYSSTYQIPKANITNALGTAGNTIGGNIPKAALTNALPVYNAVITNGANGATFTNIYYIVGGVITNVFHNP